ncbi:MAG: hypothetical protein M5U08_07345 [Burkholderiales bacterium]|nr:hypothetical protein [Burkholderiales bacterium]
MLKVFGLGAATHPLVDERERSRVLREVSGLESHRAVEELARWLRSTAIDADLRADKKAGIVRSLEAAGRVPMHMLAREYLATPRLSKLQEEHLWGGIHGFCAAAAAGYLRCAAAIAPDARAAAAKPNQVVPIAVHALRALGTQLKWEHMRYGPIDRGLWTEINRLYERLEAAGLAGLAVREFPGSPSRTSPELEFLRIAMFGACSPGSLLPAQIEIADRLTARFARWFRIASHPGPATPYRIDLAQGAPPARCVGEVSAAPAARFFGADTGHERLVALREEIASTGEAPPDLAPGAPAGADDVLEVIDHLAHYWASRLASRKYPRHGIRSRLTVVWGFEGVLDALDPLASLSFEKRAMESWIVENASAGGVGALVPSIPGEWLQVGCLVAMQPEGGMNWLLGTVKRLTRIDEASAHVGIQTLARSPTPVEFRVQTGNATALKPETGVLLDPGYTEAEVPVLLRACTNEPGRTFLLEREGRHTQLVPMAVTARGPDYEVVRCRQLVRGGE